MHSLKSAHKAVLISFGVTAPSFDLCSKEGHFVFLELIAKILDAIAQIILTKQVRAKIRRKTPDLE